MYVIRERIFRLGEDSEYDLLILASVLALDLAIDAEHDH